LAGLVAVDGETVPYHTLFTEVEVDVVHEIVIELLVGLDASTLLIIGSGIAWITCAIAKRKVNTKNIDTTIGLNL
jgi:hypothetical protein